MQTIPESVLAQYRLPDIKVITPISVGLIHSTFLIETEHGDYIAQKLHPLLGTDEIGQDFVAVTTHLEDKDFFAARAILNKMGELLTDDGEDVWRMQTAMPGLTHDVVKSSKMAKSAGSMLARFHQAVTDLTYEFKTDVVLHQTEKEYAKLLKAAKDHPELLADVQDEFNFIKEELPKLFLPNGLPERVIHGDPKISNILFDGFENAISIIDLDTCSKQTALNDLGDAMRSWCGGKEDDPENSFNKHVYDQALSGYLNEADFLTEEEKSLIPQAVGTITLELAARFLADYFNDRYFGWDHTRYENRREHNLARCRGQIAQYNDYKRKLLAIDK